MLVPLASDASELQRISIAGRWEIHGVRALHNVEQSADVEQVIHILHTAVHGALHRRFEHLNEARLNLLVAALKSATTGYVKYARIGRISNVSALYLACIC